MTAKTAEIRQAHVTAAALFLMSLSVAQEMLEVLQIIARLYKQNLQTD
jgi:hypothetical protein